MKQKMYKDDKPYVKHHNIQEGDQLLLAQTKTKTKPPYNPRPYLATNIVGHQITATRDDKTITRDAQKWKKIQSAQPLKYNQIRQQEEQWRNRRREEPDEHLLGFHKGEGRVGNRNRRICNCDYR